MNRFLKWPLSGWNAPQKIDQTHPSDILCLRLILLYSMFLEGVRSNNEEPVQPENMLDNKSVLWISTTFNYPWRTPAVFVSYCLLQTIQYNTIYLSKIYHVCTIILPPVILFIIIYHQFSKWLCIVTYPIWFIIKYHYLSSHLFVFIMSYHDVNSMLAPRTRTQRSPDTKAHLLSLESSCGRSAQQGDCDHAETMCGRWPQSCNVFNGQNEDEPERTSINHIIFFFVGSS